MKNKLIRAFVLISTCAMLLPSAPVFAAGPAETAEETAAETVTEAASDIEQADTSSQSEKTLTKEQTADTPSDALQDSVGSTEDGTLGATISTVEGLDVSDTTNGSGGTDALSSISNDSFEESQSAIPSYDSSFTGSYFGNQTENTNWNKTSDYDLTRIASITVTSDVTRYEFFYADTESEPEITLTAPSGAIYRVQDGNQATSDGDVLLCRTKNSIVDATDVAYDVLYIASTTEPGNWTLSMTISDTTAMFVALTSDTPADYADRTVESRTNPSEPFLWYDSTSDGEYYNQIATFIRADTSGSLSDSANYTPQEEQEAAAARQKQALIHLLILVGIIVALGVAGMSYWSKRNQKKIRHTKKQKELKEASEKVREQKKREDDDLDSYLDKFDSAYEDDDDEDDDEPAENPSKKASAPLSTMLSKKHVPDPDDDMMVDPDDEEEIETEEEDEPEQEASAKDLPEKKIETPDDLLDDEPVEEIEDESENQSNEDTDDMSNDLSDEAEEETVTEDAPAPAQENNTEHKFTKFDFGGDDDTDTEERQENSRTAKWMTDDQQETVTAKTVTTTEKVTVDGISDLGANAAPEKKPVERPAAAKPNGFKKKPSWL